jgi:hypothetical protein
MFCVLGLELWLDADSHPSSLRVDGKVWIVRVWSPG